ncbi:hypothetical protein ACE38V_22580 [Cytobacillus sp. Hz8]|uniref:hypothetical protein n=1 Tax=Cytobacillus sp. Hz8 TaxID=3347168 RepID=UPI0035DCDEFF
MGYQESFIRFKDEKILKEQLKVYQKRDKGNDLADIVCVDRVKKEVHPFRVGELVAVVSGERSEQRDKNRLRNGLGIKRVVDIVFIDNPIYWEMAEEQGVDLGDFLREHFETLSDEEYEGLLK